MNDSDGTCASAAASEAGPRAPAESAVSTAPSGVQVDFYVMGSTASDARHILACRLAEQAYLSDQRALLWLSDTQEQRVVDELLWTFLDGSFVPHEVLGNSDDSPAAPVMLSAGITPAQPFELLINLTTQLPACLARARRVVEIIDGAESCRRAGRARFKAYRELGMQPATHNLPDPSQPTR